MATDRGKFYSYDWTHRKTRQEESEDSLAAADLEQYTLSHCGKEATDDEIDPDHSSPDGQTAAATKFVGRIRVKRASNS